MVENSLFYKEVHALSKKISEKIDDSRTISPKIQPRLINVVDDVLIAWVEEESCFYSQIFQPINSKEENGKDSEIYKIQKLILPRAPLWQANSIIMNNATSGVLLVGEKGVCIVELPKRWGHPSLFEGGKEMLSCMVNYIGEQFFASTSRINVISADWYPGSLNYSHVIMLSSDNYLRIYSINAPDIPVKVYAVGSGRNISESRFGGGAALGETAVSFDIGSPNFSKRTPFNDKEKITDFIEEADEIKRQHYSLEWPVFILYSNGDIYYVLTSLNPKAKSSGLYGPLTMLPNSFDNYGLDFTSVIVLQCHPLVLVIGNSKGSMHHCIVIENSEEKPANDIDELSTSLASLSLASPHFVLHVYESVHLNFDHDTEKSPSAPVLISDPITPTRYWLLHHHGIYMVHVPFIEKLIYSNGLSDKSLLPENDLECQVEHFLCTQNPFSSKSTSILGFSISYSPTKAWVMLGTGAIATLPLPSVYIPNMKLSEDAIVSATSSQEAKTEVFGAHIREILKRASSQPLLLSGLDQTVDLQEYINFLKYVQDNLKKNYILPQIKAKEEIERRKKIKQQQKGFLQREIKELLSEKQILTNKAHEIADKYEESNDKHSQLIKRLERVLHHHLRDSPTLSCAEQSMFNELEMLSENGKSLSTDLTQIKAKHQWHASQKNKQEINEAIQSKRSSYISENQLVCLKFSLSKESEKLSLLTKNLKKMKNELGV